MGAVEYRTVHSKMWHDRWFSELDIEGKVLWVYLLTNSNASVSGIYLMTEKVAAFETGLPLDRITCLLSQFVLAGKIEWEGDVIWVRRMREYQARNDSSSRVLTRILKDVMEVPEGRVKQLYVQRYGIDTVSIPYGDTDTVTATVTDTIPRAKTERQFAMLELEAYFSEVTKLPKPPRETDKEKRAAAESWWVPLGGLYDVVGKDAREAKSLIKATVIKMTNDGLTIACPRSIEKVARSEWAKQKRTAISATQPAKVYR